MIILRYLSTQTATTRILSAQAVQAEEVESKAMAVRGRQLSKTW